MIKLVAGLGVVLALSACAPLRPATVIPIEIVEGNAVTAARIGTETFDLIVDTGGFGGLAIAPKDLSRIQVVFTDTWTERTDAAGDSFKSREFLVPELFIGSRSFKSVHGYERNSSTSGFAGGEPINVLGRAFLQQYTVVVDYPNGRIELYEPNQGASICGEKLSDLFMNQDEHLIVRIQTDAGGMLALMDTGATYSFVQSSVVESREMSIDDDLYTTTMLKIGNRDFGRFEMVVLPIYGAPEIDALIGSNFFARHKVCFDYKNRSLSVSP